MSAQGNTTGPFSYTWGIADNIRTESVVEFSPNVNYTVTDGSVSRPPEALPHSYYSFLLDTFGGRSQSIIKWPCYRGLNSIYQVYCDPVIQHIRASGRGVSCNYQDQSIGEAIAAAPDEQET